MQNLTTFATSMVALLGAILGILKYFQYRSRRDKVALVRDKFDAVVRSLASTVEVERMSGAILLRRFYDPDTEVGMAGTPYWKEAVNVSAAILRGQATGNFQELLADGLAFAPSLARADLQRTNLQFAYLGSRTISTEKTRPGRHTRGRSPTGPRMCGNAAARDRKSPRASAV